MDRNIIEHEHIDTIIVEEEGQLIVVLDRVKDFFSNIEFAIQSLDVVFMFLVFLGFFLRKRLLPEIFSKSAGSREREILDPILAWERTDLLSMITKSTSKDREIKDILQELKRESTACRVVLGLFHNTSSYGFNYHLLKVSIFHEVRDENIKSIKGIVKDVPLSYLNEEFKLYEEGENRFVCHLTEDLAEGCRMHLNLIDVETVVNYLLILRGTPIGILAFQYSDQQGDLFKDIEGFESIVEKRTGKNMLYFTDRLTGTIARHD